MKLKKITIENFRGFSGRHEFDFEEKALIMLTAPNGNGKTSLLDAIEWCLTGNIKRIQDVYQRRNTNATERKENRSAVLKNENHLTDKTEVILEIKNDTEEYTIRRVQSKDTLEDKGKVYVNQLSGEQAEEKLESMTDLKNFYKYHFCDMQKTFNFLTKSRDDMEVEFADFSSDYSEAENVVHNLELYIKDLETYIENSNQEKAKVEKDIKNCEEAIEKYKSSAEILPYNSQILFAGEQTDIKNMTLEQLQEQLQALYRCGYTHAYELLGQKQNSASAEKIRKELEVIKKELSEQEDHIKETLKKEANKAEVRTAAEREYKKYSDMKLTKESLAGNREELFKLNHDNFTQDYWKESSERLEELQKAQKTLQKELKTLNKGNEILDILTSITNGKESLTAYRKEMQKHGDGITVQCPVCGSEQFGIIDEHEITKQAQEYQAEHKELIEQKKKDEEKLKKDVQKIEEERLSKAEAVLREAVENAKEKFESLISLYNATKVYFDSLQTLQKVDKDIFSSEKMLIMSTVDEEIKHTDEKILSQEKIAELDTEVQKILQNVNYSDKEELSPESLLEEVGRRAENAPENVAYDEKLLFGKISSVRSYISNTEYVQATQKHADAKKKTAQIEGDIVGWNKLIDKANKRKNKIATAKDELKEEEYNQVGPYLFKFFCKLSRDVRIGGMDIKFTDGKKVALLNDKNSSLLNIFSDGQLSVFMLSYFLGNIFRLKDVEKMPIYFIDDITSCMDDINMLAFIDLLKYQLLDSGSAMKQIFFATCDNRIEDLLEYKIKNCGIAYKKLDAKAFQQSRV